MPDIPAIIAAHRAERYPLREPVEIEPDDHLFEDLHFDSLDRVELCLAVEEQFNLPQINEGRVFFVRDLMAAANGKVPA